MTEQQEVTHSIEAIPPDKNHKRSNIMLMTILACWLLLLYFLGGLKGPG